MNKRANETVMSEVVLILASVVVFSVIILFVNMAAKSTLYYEEVYAKKIGLSIEASPPGTILAFDISGPYKISKENKLFKTNFEESFKSKFFYYDNTNSIVRIKLADSGGYQFDLMSKKVVKRFDVNIYKDEQVLIIEVGG